MNIEGTAWTMTSYAGAGGTMVAASQGARLAFASYGALSGSTGCNSFSGTYMATSSRLTVTIGPMTQMACLDPAVMAQETAVTKQLPMVASYDISGDRLTLSSGSNNPLFIYAAAKTTLPGTSWQVTGVNDGKGGVVSTTQTEQLTAKFGTDATFTAFGGCNGLFGTYTTSGTSGLTIGRLSSTRKSCGDGVDQLESEYSTALGQVASYDISGDILMMRDAKGSTQVTAVVAR
jgi:heat shock protein HslJ